MMTLSKLVNPYNSTQIFLIVTEYYFHLDFCYFKKSYKKSTQMMTSHAWWLHIHDDVVFNILRWLLFVIFCDWDIASFTKF